MMFQTIMLHKNRLNEAENTLKPYIEKLCGIAKFSCTVKLQYERLILTQKVLRSFLRRHIRHVETMRQVFYQVFNEYKMDLGMSDKPADKTRLKSLEDFNWHIAYDFCRKYVHRCN